MSTVLILLDAFRHDYLTQEATPFLFACAQEGEHFQMVEQSFGFCERSEILTGMHGAETGFFTAIGFDPDHSPYQRSRLLPVLDRLEHLILPLLRLLPQRLGLAIHKRMRTAISRRLRRKGTNMLSYNIPFSWLPYFALTEDFVDHRSPEAFPGPSILTQLQSRNRTYYYDTFTALNYRSQFRSDSARLDAVIRDIADSPKDLYLIYLSAPDAFGHRYGPESIELKSALRNLDSSLNRFVKELEKITPGNRYLFIGDHGMLPVSKIVDAETEIDTLLHAGQMTKAKDVIYFLDSTMVRFWAMSKSAGDKLPSVLMRSKLFESNGTWMNEKMAADYHVRWPDRRYGDYLWLAHPGILVFPDFFHHLVACRGMHGYDPTLPESKGMCIYWGNGIEAKTVRAIPLASVFGVLKRSLEL